MVGVGAPADGSKYLHVAGIPELAAQPCSGVVADKTVEVFRDHS
jgi:hypothetical protein